MSSNVLDVSPLPKKDYFNESFDSDAIPVRPRQASTIQTGNLQVVDSIKAGIIRRLRNATANVRSQERVRDITNDGNSCDVISHNQSNIAKQTPGIL